MSQTLLVTGASGQLGQRVIHHLLETYKVPAASIIAATRDPAKLTDLAAKGVAVRQADFDDAASLPAAFAGVDRLLIISTDALAVPGQRLAQHSAAAAAAVKAGVKHLLYTSMPAPETSLVSFAPDHAGSEKAVKDSGIGYTILRNAWYIDNYLHALPHNLQTGQWFSAAGSGRVSNIAREDCAIAIAAALAADTTTSATYTLTGATSDSIAEVAATVTEVTGKPLQVIPVSDEQYGEGLTGAGFPGFVVDMLVSAEANTRAGKFDIVTDDFKTLTGREPQSLKTFFEEHRAALTA